MEAIIKGRRARAFAAFSKHGEFITFETYTGAARALAALNGQDPDGAAVRALTEELGRMWQVLCPLADTNRDGRIDRAEWDAYSEIEDAGMQELDVDGAWPLDPYITRLFAVIDADGDGRITQREFAMWLTSMNLAEDTDIPGVFAAFDGNGDGTISMEEFSRYSRQYWTTTDARLPGSRWLGP